MLLLAAATLASLPLATAAVDELTGPPPRVADAGADVIFFIDSINIGQMSD